MKEALEITTQEKADKWLVTRVEEMNKNNPTWTWERCAETVRSNLGYMAGYYDSSVAQHIHKFFGANHPIFGGHDYHKKTTPQTAYDKGMAEGITHI